MQDSMSVADAVKPDGFVDLYQLLNVPSDAPQASLSTRINQLYSEAQANRDHRNLAKRREYQLLLELLPQCRTVLLNEDNRARYDAYAGQVRQGTATMDYDTFVESLGSSEGGEEASGVGLLGVREDSAVKTTVRSSRPGIPVAPVAPSSMNRLPSAARASLMASVISIAVFFVLFLVLHMVAKIDIPIAVLISAVIAVVTWVVTHRKPPTRISS